MIQQLEENKYYWAQFNRFELRMPTEAIEELSGPGEKDGPAEKWSKEVEFFTGSGNPMVYDSDRRIVIYRGSSQTIREELKEYGAWSEDELNDDAMNIQRLIWIAAGNIAEEECHDDSDPVWN